VKARHGNAGAARPHKEKSERTGTLAAQTYPNILVHCVFSTKNRFNTIPDDLRGELSMYFVGIGKGQNIPVLCAGGNTESCSLNDCTSGDRAVSKGDSSIEANSSRWLGEHGLDFAWQEGYGHSASVRRTPMALRNCIDHQDEHHSQSFVWG
jgi:hypothetical protein